MAVLKSGDSTDQAHVTPAKALSVDASATIQPVSAISLPLPTNAAQEVGGNLAAISSAQAHLIDGSQKSQVVSGTGVVVDVSAKGVQGVNAIAAQDLKDAGRVIKILTLTFSPTAAENMLSMIPVTDGAVGSANTSFSVTTGKRYRIQALLLSVENTTAAIRGTQVNLRMSASGAVTTANPIIASLGATTPAATLALAVSQAQSFPDGIELSGSMQYGISASGTVLGGSTVILVGYEY